MFPVTLSRINPKSSYSSSSPSFQSSGYSKGVAADTFSTRFGAALAEGGDQAIVWGRIKELWRSEDTSERVLTAEFVIDNVVDEQERRDVLEGLARTKDEVIHYGLLLALYPYDKNDAEVRLARIDNQLRQELTERFQKIMTWIVA